MECSHPYNYHFINTLFIKSINMKTLYKHTILVFSIISVIGCKENIQKDSGQPISQLVTVVDTVQKSYQLKKFTQYCCKSIVEFSLKQRVEGFIKAESDTKKGQITVWFDNQKNTEKDIKEAINKTPYKIEKEI